MTKYKSIYIEEHEAVIVESQYGSQYIEPIKLKQPEPIWKENLLSIALLLVAIPLVIAIALYYGNIVYQLIKLI